MATFSFKKFLTLSLLFISLLVGLSGWAQRDIPSRPDAQTSVYDDAHILSGSQKSQLEQKLITYADSTSTQIVVVSINSLQGEYIGTYAPEWAQKWGIGQSKEDNGLLIMVAKDDHKVWITNGYGLEEFMTDATTKTIIDNIITPEFKKGDFYSGLDNGTTAIFQVLAGKFKGSPREKAGKQGFPIRLIFPIIIFIIIIISMIRRNKGGKGGGSTGGLLFDAIILSSLGRGGFGGGSSGGFGGGGGGGFGGGFGGGGFGGGGAGGSW